MHPQSNLKDCTVSNPCAAITHQSKTVMKNGTQIATIPHCSVHVGQGVLDGQEPVRNVKRRMNSDSGTVAILRQFAGNGSYDGLGDAGTIDEDEDADNGETMETDSADANLHRMMWIKKYCRRTKKHYDETEALEVAL